MPTRPAAGPTRPRRPVAARTARAQYIGQEGRSFHILLGEQALHTEFGGPEVMRGQLHRLLEATDLPALSLGIIPRPRSPPKSRDTAELKRSRIRTGLLCAARRSFSSGAPLSTDRPPGMSASVPGHSEAAIGLDAWFALKCRQGAFSSGGERCSF
ncbi:Scr1 family TA system antitoxin-like transcriptional regulator [Streptomyces yangpuensis]|uniref:Scr1 family TA system antitoxin-like transcriptional regulator n=1 Tax=Streptomyces yangpuensis TaxID=1648182 RepID=UPI00380797ED